MSDITTFEEHLDQRYGKTGTAQRTDFEIKAKAFAIGEILRDARKEAIRAVPEYYGPEPKINYRTRAETHGRASL